MAPNAPTAPPPQYRSRAHDLLLAAFVAGATLDAAAATAGVCRRTAARWKKANQAELAAAHAAIQDAALATVRDAVVGRVLLQMSSKLQPPPPMSPGRRASMLVAHGAA